jgi:hypothetical protein
LTFLSITLALQKGLVSEGKDMDWRRLNLDITKDKSFDFQDAIYLNEETVPLERLIEYIKQIQNELKFYGNG